MRTSPAEPEPVAEPPVPLENAQLSLKVRTLDQKTYPITICATASVPQLKEVVAVETGVTLARQRLIYRGRVLKNDQPLAAYALEDGHVLHLVVRALPSNDAANQASTLTVDSNPDGTGTIASSARPDPFERASLPVHSGVSAYPPSPPPLQRDNDEPDPTMGRPGRTGPVLMGATIAVPDGTEVTMPFLNSMIANFVTQVNESGTGTEGGDLTAAARGTRRSMVVRDAMGNGTPAAAAEMHAATARALRRHHRNREGAGRSRFGRRALSSAERQLSLRARMGLRLQSVRATLDDAALEVPPAPIASEDSSTALSEVQQQVEMLLTLVHRFGPQLRLLAAALAQRDRASGSVGGVPPGGTVPPVDPTGPVGVHSSSSGDTSTSPPVPEPSMSPRHVSRTIEVLTTIGESIELLASMARHAFVRQAVQAGERARQASPSPSGGTRGADEADAASLLDASGGPGTGGDALPRLTRGARLDAQSALTASRPRLRFRINATEVRPDRPGAAPPVPGSAALASARSSVHLPRTLMSLASTTASSSFGPTRSMDAVAQWRRADADGAPHQVTTSVPPANAHVSIAGMDFPLVSSVVLPFSLAAGLGGSHATTTWNFADFVSRVTNELPVSTLYGVLAGDPVHLHHVLAHIGFALFSGVDVPRVTRPNLRTWVHELATALEHLLRDQAVPAGVRNEIGGPADRRMAVGDELLRLVRPFLSEVVDLLVRATSASRAAAFGSSSAAALRTMMHQVVRQLRDYARGAALETEDASDERLKRLLCHLLRWGGLHEGVARFLVDTLVVWVQGRDRRGSIRTREASGRVHEEEALARKRRRE